MIKTQYIYGKKGNNPVVELVACFNLIRIFVPNDLNHPTCLKLQQDAKRLIKEIYDEQKKTQTSQPER